MINPMISRAAAASIAFQISFPSLLCRALLSISNLRPLNIVSVGLLGFHINNQFNVLFIPSIILDYTSTAAFSTSSSQIPKIREFLQKSCGLSPQQAILASKPLVCLKSSQNPEKVLQFFREHGLGDAHISNLIVRRPTVLASSVQKTLQPKVRVLESLGIMGNKLGSLFSKDPYLLGISFSRRLLPGISFLQKMIESNDSVAKVVTREPWILHRDLEKKVKPNFLFLQSIGLDEKLLWKYFVRQPRFFLYKQTQVKDVVNTVEKLGLPPHSRMFPHAIFVVSCMQKTILERKIKFLISLGLSKEEVLLVFRKSPAILSSSEENVQSHMDFLVNTLKYEPSDILVRSRFLLTGMETCIRPRYRVLQMLQSMQLPQKSFSLLNMFCVSEKTFLQRFVFKYGEASGLYDAYKGIDSTPSSPYLDVKDSESKKKEPQ